MSQKSLVCLGFLFAVATSAVAHAQDFSTVRLKGLPRLYVEDRSGTEVSGTLITVSDAALVVAIDGAPRTFTPSEVTKVERRGDSLKNGLIIGAVFGMIAPLIADCPSRHPDGECRGGSRVAFMLGGMAIWGGIGAGIDALISGRTRVWPVPSK